ncbi:MAG: hypothetical protein HYV97_07015 [Bdellovibrio sp.]|nr:hypothetical protein [Bdellovibrio sp.]
MSMQAMGQAQVKIKAKKNSVSYRLIRSKELFPTDSSITITHQDFPKEFAQEITMLEILGESNAPIPSTISQLEWHGPFPTIKKIILCDLRLCSLILDEKNFLMLENIVLKNVSFQNMTLEEFIQTLPSNLKNLSLIRSGPFGPTRECPKNLLTHLEQLDLSYNQLQELPSWIETLTSLKRLTLDGNKLEALPLYLKKLPKLNHLSLDDNPFSEETKGQIQRDFNLWFS